MLASWIWLVDETCKHASLRDLLAIEADERILARSRYAREVKIGIVQLFMGLQIEEQDQDVWHAHAFVYGL